LCSPAPAGAADDVLARVRARGVLHCAGIVRPGFAVPTVDGKHWYGLSADVCRAVAAAVLGSAQRMEFRPYFDGGPADGRPDETNDIVFVSDAQLVGGAAASAAPLQLGPVIAHDALALLVPATGAKRIADLANRTVCVEPGSPADRAIASYFAQHTLTLHEHPFQETDEMRQAYAAGHCDALAGPLSTLASVRVDPQDGHRSDRILPELLADDPIFAATAADARWSRIVWWTFSVLVDAENARIGAHPSESTIAVAGVPPAVGTELGLAPQWARKALAGGDYGQLLDRDLGARSRFDLPRGANALWQHGGLIFGLRVQ